MAVQYQAMLGLTKNRIKQILKLATPIMLGMVSHNIIDLIDILMISAKGETAIASVGLAGGLAFFCLSCLIGFSAAVQTITARRLGEGKTKQLAVALTESFKWTLLTAIPFSLVMYYFSPQIFSFLSPDVAVSQVSTDYFQYRILGFTFFMCNFLFRGYWNGIKKPMPYLGILVFTHACNAFLNWVFIFGNLGAPELGVAGAGLASALSVGIGTAVYFLSGFMLIKNQGFLVDVWKINESALPLLKLAWPFCTRQGFHALWILSLYWLIALLGTTELAIANVLINILLFLVLPGVGFGQATQSLVSEALGQNDRKEVKQWAWDVIKLASLGLFFAGLIILIFPRFFIGFFIHNPETIEMAVPVLRLDAITIWIEVIGIIISHGLHGTGDTKTVMYLSTPTEWLIKLPLMYVLGITLNYGLMGIWVGIALYNIAITGVYIFIWQRERWGNTVI